MALRKASEVGAQHVLYECIEEILEQSIELDSDGHETGTGGVLAKYLVSHQFFTMGADGSVLVNAPHFELRFGVGAKEKTPTESEYYYTPEELGVTSEKEARAVIKEANDSAYLSAVKDLDQYRTSSQRLNVVAAIPLRVIFRENVVARFHSWYLDHGLEAPTPKLRSRKAVPSKAAITSIYKEVKGFYTKQIIEYEKNYGTKYGAHKYADEETQKKIMADHGFEVACKKIRSAMRNA